MRKYQSKEQLLSHWTDKIDNQKHYYDILIKFGQVETPFEDSEIYKQLSKRKQRAEYRYDNREKISEQRKERRELHKQQREYIEENADEISESFSGSGIDAFSGRKGLGDAVFAKNVGAKNFAGNLLVVNEDGEEEENRFFYSISAYFERLAYWIHRLFSKSDGYKIFNTEVTKKQKFDKTTNTLYYYTEILIGDE